MKRIWLLITLVLSISVSIFALPLQSINEKVFSETNGYYANIKSRGNNVNELQVYDSLNILLWSAWIDWDDDWIKALSNDGRIFVLVSREYSNLHPLVTIYRKDKQEAYSTKLIAIGQEGLKREGSKQIWIRNEKGNVEIKYDASGNVEELDLVAVSGKIYSISLK